MVDVEVTEWYAESDKARDYANRVFSREIREISADVDHFDRKDERLAKRVEREVEFDAGFAKHHLDYLDRVVAREVKRAERLAGRIAEAEEDGKVEKAEKLTARLEKQEADSLEHIEHVAAHVFEHLERDGKAAAEHIVHALAKASENDEEFAKRLEDAENKAEEALAKRD